MGHSIQAIVGRVEALEAARAWFGHLIIVPLGQGLSMIPATHAFLDATYEYFGGRQVDATLDAFIYGNSQLVHALSALSTHSPVAYVETDYFGGHGTQSAAAYVGGSVSMVAKDREGSINQALKILGVMTNGHPDEFEAVGLHRHRNMDRWTDDD